MRAQPVELDKELSVEFHSALSVPPQALPSNSLTANDAAKGWTRAQRGLPKRIDLSA
jgi:hypothetical protein